METLVKWREILERTLQEYANLPYPHKNVLTYVVVSRDRNHFFLLHEGWQDNKRIHGMVVHAELRDDKVWIHYDGIEDSITADLMAAGIPKKSIVLAFHPPDVRKHTGYAIA